MRDRFPLNDQDRAQLHQLRASMKGSPLTQDQRDLLGSFRDGPKVWDAAALFTIVCGLEKAGYVRFVADGPAAEITDAGRAALAEPKSETQAGRERHRQP